MAKLIHREQCFACFHDYTFIDLKKNLQDLVFWSSLLVSQHHRKNQTKNLENNKFLFFYYFFFYFLFFFSFKSLFCNNIFTKYNQRETILHKIKTPHHAYTHTHAHSLGLRDTAQFHNCSSRKQMSHRGPPVQKFIAIAVFRKNIFFYVIVIKDFFFNHL